MARVSGVDLPRQKAIGIALRYVSGLGPKLATDILNAVGVDARIRVKDLTEEDVSKISGEISRGYRVEGDLRRDIQQNIRRLIEINSYRGFRHRRNLPVHGQRTKSNARTRRGRRKTVGAAAKKTA